MAYDDETVLEAKRLIVQKGKTVEDSSAHAETEKKEPALQSGERAFCVGAYV